MPFGTGLLPLPTGQPVHRRTCATQRDHCATQQPVAAGRAAATHRGAAPSPADREQAAKPGPRGPDRRPGPTTRRTAGAACLGQSADCRARALRPARLSPARCPGPGPPGPDSPAPLRGPRRPPRPPGRRWPRGSARCAPPAGRPVRAACPRARPQQHPAQGRGDDQREQRDPQGGRTPSPAGRMRRSRTRPQMTPKQATMRPKRRAV